MKTKTDNEKIKDLIALSKANPDMQIITMVNNEVCPDDDHSFWLGSIGKIEKDFVYFAEGDEGEHVLIGNSRIYDFIYEKIEFDDCECELTEDDIGRKTEKEIEELKLLGKITEKIIVYIETPEI